MGAAAAWSVLCGALELAGHGPSGPTPLPHWYGIQALLVWAVVPLQAAVADRVVVRLMGPVGAGAGRLGWSVVVAGLVATDLAAWGLLGFARLGSVLPFTLTTSVLWGIGVGTWSLRTSGRTVGARMGAMGAAIAVAAVLGAPVLR